MTNNGIFRNYNYGNNYDSVSFDDILNIMRDSTSGGIARNEKKIGEEIKNKVSPKVSPFEIKRVIFNNPATIVYWQDGTKTVVKAYNEPFDIEKGLAMAICKKVYGNTGRYNDIFKKFDAFDSTNYEDDEW